MYRATNNETFIWMPVNWTNSINMSIKVLYCYNLFFFCMFIDVTNYTFFISKSTNNFSLRWSKADVKDTIDSRLDPLLFDIIQIQIFKQVNIRKHSSPISNQDCLSVFKTLNSPNPSIKFIIEKIFNFWFTCIDEINISSLGLFVVA